MSTVRKIVKVLEVDHPPNLTNSELSASTRGYEADSRSFSADRL